MLDQWVTVCIRYDRNSTRKTAVSAMPASAPTGRRSTRSLSSCARRDAQPNIYREKVTGARADRRELLRMLTSLAPGDVVTVTRIDRLARSTFDLFAIVKRIVDAGGQFRSLGGAVGRHRHQHRAADDCRSRRAGGRGARSYPHPHGGRQEPRQGARAAHGPPPEAHAAAAGRSHGGGGRRARRSRNWPRATTSAGDDFEAQDMSGRNGSILHEIIMVIATVCAAISDPTSTVLRKMVAEIRGIAGGVTGRTVMWC